MLHSISVFSTDHDVFRADKIGNLYYRVEKADSADLEKLDGESNDLHIVQFCQKSAVPMHVVEYEGVVSIPSLLLAAQLCILLGLLHVWDLFVDKLEYQTAYRESSTVSAIHAGSIRGLSQMVKIAIAVVLLLGYLYLTNVDTNWRDRKTDMTQTGYRSPNHTTRGYSTSNVFVVLALVVVVLVEIVYEFIEVIATKRHNKAWIVQFNRHGPMAAFVDRIGADVPIIFGFALLGMAVMLQADISNSTTVLTGVFILVSAGFVQHISNLVKILYVSMCSRMSSDVVMGLTLHDEKRDKPGERPVDNDEVTEILKSRKIDVGGNASVRKVMLFFGWTRLYFFMFVVVLGISFFTLAKDGTGTGPIMSMLHGQVLYFTFAFILSNVGYDLAFEMLPMQFEGFNADRLRIYTISAYLVAFNVNQILYLRKIDSQTLHSFT